MKRNMIILVILFCSFFRGGAQSQPLTTSWFTVKEVSPKVWAIDDRKAVNICLVEGSDSAMVIDTWMGVSDLLAQVMKLT